MQIFLWSLRAEWKFTVVWTSICTLAAAAILLLVRLSNGGFRPVEAVGAALLLPFAGWLTAPLFWRIFIIPNLREVEKKRAQHEQSSRTDATPGNKS